MSELNFKEKEQFDYDVKQYDKNPSEILVEFVNHNEEQFFDFVIFLNNPMKFKSQKQECDSFKYVKLLYANICFCNYAYIHGYDYKEISKLPNEVDPRKYLDKIKKKDQKDIQEALNTDNPEKEKKDEKKSNENKIVENKSKDQDIGENGNGFERKKQVKSKTSKVYFVCRFCQVKFS